MSYRLLVEPGSPTLLEPTLIYNQCHRKLLKLLLPWLPCLPINFPQPHLCIPTSHPRPSRKTFPGLLTNLPGLPIRCFVSGAAMAAPCLNALSITTLGTFNLSQDLANYICALFFIPKFFYYYLIFILAIRMRYPHADERF